MPKAEQGLGTVRRIFNRRGEVIWYQALLPRHLSTPPVDCKRPQRYQEPLGDRFMSEEDARGVLTAAIAELRVSPLRTALGLDAFVAAEIQAREHAAWRRYKHKAKARRASSTWRSIDKRWLAKAPWYRWQPKAIGLSELQAWFDVLVNRAVGKRGAPLSAHFIHQVRDFCSAAFVRAKVVPNPAESVVLPKKQAPRVPFLDMGAQFRFYQSAAVELEDRALVGCGMGAGLRVGELLALEAVDLHLDGADPHLIVRYGGQHRSPPKGGLIRRVELFEPGLGFFRLWMQKFYRGGALVFLGPEGGFRSHWAERFPSWSEIAGVTALTSHIMRHSYAVSILSGSWGYDPQSLEFVQQQLGHAERSTTERYYGAFEAGIWQREVRRMTGAPERTRRPPVTAAALLGIEPSGAPGGRLALVAGSGADVTSDGAASASQHFQAAIGADAFDPRHSPRIFPPVISAAASWPPDGTHQATEKARSFLAAAAAGETERALALGVTLATAVLELIPEAADGSKAGSG